MADKPEFVDLISDATRQSRRHVSRIIDLAPVVVKKTSRLSHWPPDSVAQWRLRMLTPWKLKPWK